ncbi:MAG: cbb3-type cytochrome c oxidase subunit 3 [Gammaproteobacteria bacterium]|nr:MAG: cbb3-type cytochrome c oxidase subunit 3 [Gammaproteobacteria bacterium]
MDMNDLRALSTVLMFLTFLGIIFWTVIGGPDRFRDDANLPFADDDHDESEPKQEKSS